jgi:hypothetical protein
MMAPLEEATMAGVVGEVEGTSPHMNGLRLPWRASILRVPSSRVIARG